MSSCATRLVLFARVSFTFRLRVLRMTRMLAYMDRRPLETDASNREDYSLHPAVRVWNELPKNDPYDDNTCQNCRQISERLTFIPEFEYMGCDDCVGEALA